MSYLRSVLLILCVTWVPAGASAQTAPAPLSGSIAGVVRDVTGGALPGVTVEARGDASARLTAVTDAAGQYRIERVPAGRYQVVFTLVNFASLVRNDVAVRASAPDSTHVDAVMRLSLSADV